MTDSRAATRHQPELVSADLLDLTLALGQPERDLVILAEGNTSERLDDERIAVKASGCSMREATADDFVTVDIATLAALAEDPGASQEDLTAVLDAGPDPVTGRRRRASIESLVHAAVHALAPDPAAARFVGHTHPTDVVGLLASVHADSAYDEFVYSDEAVVIGRPLFVDYAQPGIALGRLVLRSLRARRDDTGEFPQLILLGNHGIVAVAPSVAGVLAVSAMAVKGARVRVAALAAGGLRALPADSVSSFFARADIAERRAMLAGRER